MTVHYDYKGEPIPDGKLIVRFRDKVDHHKHDSDDDAYELVFEFRDFYSHSPLWDGLILYHRDKGGRIHIPWSAILYYEITYNSEEVAKAIDLWRELHETGQVN